jgi:hypothetical protein
MPAIPFQSRDYASDRDTKTGQTPDGIAHSEVGYRQHSSGDTGHKRQHPPKHNESPGAFFASHSRLQNRNVTSRGILIFLYTNIAREKTAEPVAFNKYSNLRGLSRPAAAAMPLDRLGIE